jgi:hypothetical protein
VIDGRVTYWWTPDGIVRRRLGCRSDSMRRLRAERKAAGLTTAGTVRTPQRTLHDIDPVAVALTVGGQRGLALNQGEKRAVAALTLDRPRQDVADLLGCSIPNVDRLRKLAKETSQ